MSGRRTAVTADVSVRHASQSTRLAAGARGLYGPVAVSGRNTTKAIGMSLENVTQVVFEAETLRILRKIAESAILAGRQGFASYRRMAMPCRAAQSTSSTAARVRTGSLALTRSVKVVPPGYCASFALSAASELT